LELDGEYLDNVIIHLGGISRSHENKYDYVTFDVAGEDYEGFSEITIIGHLEETDEEFEKRCDRLDKHNEKNRRKKEEKKNGKKK